MSGGGSEFVLACDMRFAARESAVFAQFEAAIGVIPGAGAAQHLARLIGRGRALEVLLSAQDYDAELAERYSWVNRTLLGAELGEFVGALAHRIAGFPAGGQAAIKEQVNAIALAPVEDFRRDADALLLGCPSSTGAGSFKRSTASWLPDARGRTDSPRMLGELDQ